MARGRALEKGSIRMRICLVSREFAPFFGAGIGTYASLMAKAWGEAGHEVHVLTADHWDLKQKGPELRPGVRFHVADWPRETAVTWGLKFDFMARAFGVFRSLRRLHAEIGFDYIEFPDYWGEGYFALRARQLLGEFEGPVMGVRLHTPSEYCHELNRDSWMDESRAVLEHIEREAILQSDVLISPCGPLLEWVRERYAPGHRGCVVPYAFDLGSVAELESGEGEEGARGSPPEVLYYGRIERRKGVHVLVEAAQRVLERGTDARFRFIGGDTKSGPAGRSMLEHVRSRVSERWRDRIVFEPSRPRTELGRAIRGAAACCFPSLWENFPNVVLESMAMGAAVVGSRVGGIGEVIEHGKSGWLVEAGDADGLSHALSRLLDDEPLRKRLGAGARDRVATYCDPGRVVEMTVEAVEGTRAGRGARVVVGEGGRNGSPLVSVIVPHYNLGKYLPETLRSVRRQTFRDYEIVVVDDGSTEASSLAVIDRIASRAEDVRVVRRANGGLSAARNTGLRAARGKYVLPLDADDMLHPTFLEKAVGALRRDPGLAFVTSMVAYFESDPGKHVGGWLPLGTDRDIMCVTNCASTCTALMPREAVEAAGGYDEWLTSYEDWDLYCALAERGLRGAVIPEVLFFYRIRSQSMMRTEGLAKRDRIRSDLQRKHPGLALRPDRALRLQLGNMPGPGHDQTRHEAFRYVVADRINAAIKRTPIHAAMKELASRVMGSNGVKK